MVGLALAEGHVTSHEIPEQYTRRIGGSVIAKFLPQGLPLSVSGIPPKRCQIEGVHNVNWRFSAASSESIQVADTPIGSLNRNRGTIRFLAHAPIGAGPLSGAPW